MNLLSHLAKTPLASSVIVLSLAPLALHSAITLASWENDHLAGNEVSTVAGEASSAGSWNAGLASAPVLSRGSGGTAVAYTDTFGMKNANSADLATAIANHRYLTFTLAAAPGYLLELDGVEARLQAQNATNYTVSFAVMTDRIGFKAEDELGIWTVGGTGNNSDWLGQWRSLNLSGVSALQGVESAEFRLYIFGQNGANDQVGIGRAFQHNGTPDLVVAGTIVPVPEPGTWALFAGILALGFVAVRRGRR
jgi:hypothetical protein